MWKAALVGACVLAAALVPPQPPAASAPDAAYRAVVDRFAIAPNDAVEQMLAMPARPQASPSPQ